jgi:uncharacterized membrane protein YkoI
VASRLVAVLLLALVAAALPTRAQAPRPAEPSADVESVREAVRKGRFVAVEALIEWIEKRYYGRALSVELELELEGDGEPPAYEIEWLTPANHVLEFEFDALTGELLEIEGRGLEEARRR